MNARRIGLTLLCAVFTGCQGGKADSARVDTSSVAPSVSVQDSIRTLEQVWADAVRTKDSAALERVVAEDFTLTSADTSSPPVARAMWMENTLHNLRVDSVRISPANVVTQGDTAIARLNFFWAGQFKTMPPFRDSTELTDTWVRNGGEWRVHKRFVVE